MTRIVDIHARAFAGAPAPKAMSALKVISALIEGARDRLRAHYDGAVGGLVTEVERTGVDISVIQPVATRPSRVASISDWATNRASFRIVPFGAMRPDLEDPASEIECVRALHGTSSSFAAFLDGLPGITTTEGGFVALARAHGADRVNASGFLGP